MIRRRILQKKLRPYVSGQRASLQSMDHVALGVIPKSRPDSGYWNPALEEEEIVSVILLFSSPEHKVLKVSYCDRPLSVVCHPPSICHQLLL